MMIRLGDSVQENVNFLLEMLKHFQMFEYIIGCVFLINRIKLYRSNIRRTKSYFYLVSF